MKALYEATESIILTNYNGELSKEELDVLTVAALALIVKNPRLSKERLPIIFDKLEIHIEDKTVLEMITERYPNYPKADADKHSNALVVRALASNEDDSPYEEWSMYISTKNLKNKSVDIVSRSIHELVHLLRFNGLVADGDEIKVRDGIAITRVNKKTDAVKKKHFNMEEAIVENYTIQTVDALYEFIKDEDVSFSPILSGFKKNCGRDFAPTYEPQRMFLDLLARDKEFAKLIDDSFENTGETPKMIEYFNSKVGSPSGFTVFSRTLDNLIEAAYAEDGARIRATVDDLHNQAKVFHMGRKY